MAGKVTTRPNALQRLIHRFLMLQPVSAVLAVVLRPLDTLLLRLTNNVHTFTEMVGLPILQLTTIGAKTGQPRQALLVGVQDGKRIALIASNFGRAHNPGWYYNLKAKAECQILWNGKTGTYLAHEAEGTEREEFWQLALSYYAGYEKYRARTNRRIPVMIVEPKERFTGH
jgi:deazaflavin-dependent oxidoreductase (nitroreductase family)